ncbi:MAG: hypothetical protein H6Q13_1072 [Bacteroidetes bacterium]|nr:hypothetical protein [Bacteroidota bacterium]
MENNDLMLLYTTLTKTELAQMYLPEATPAVARRKLNEWILRNQPLALALAHTGYTHSTRMLTPAQVRLIIQYLGEP